MTREPIKILCDILAQQMVLTANQLYIYNQEFKIPTTSGLFVVVQYVNSTPYSTHSEFITSGIGVQEEITAYIKEEYIINVFSANDEARQRKEEVLFAMKSTFALQLQEKYAFRIAQVQSNILDISQVEGGKMLNRYAINIKLLTWYNKTFNADYYDTFLEPTILIP